MLVLKKAEHMLRLKTPLQEEDIKKLKIGDEILLSGVVFTARDKAHQFLLEEDFNEMKNSVVYHCGPIIKGKEVIAAGPTTSARLNKYTPALIKKYNIKGIIGKGGMDDSVAKAIKDKAVYFSAIGGLAVIYAKKMRIKDVYKKEFGMPEAIWKIEIEDFPVVITIDFKGNSLYKKVYQNSKKQLSKLIR